MDYLINDIKMSLGAGKKVKSGSLISMCHRKCEVDSSFVLKK